MTNSQFKKEFPDLQASFGFEGQQLTATEAEQIRKVCTGQISKTEYDTWLQEWIRENAR